MKRFLSGFLCLLLVFSAVTAWGAPEPKEGSLEWKLSKQLQNGSALKLKVSFSGDTLPKLGLDAKAAETLLKVLSGVTIEVNTLKAAGTQKGKAQTQLKALKGEEKLAEFSYITDGALESFTCDLLDHNLYAAAKGESLLSGLMLSGADKWPGFGRILLAINTADNAWTTRANRGMERYTAKLGSWLQAYTVMANERSEEGELQVSKTITLPGALVKKQIKEMLETFFSDEEMLSVLKEQFTLRESEAYLNADMKEAFLQAIDALVLTEELQVKQLYAQDGTLLKSDATFPMRGALGLQQVNYGMLLEEDKTESTTLELVKMPLNADHASGTSYALSFVSEDKTEGKGLNLSGSLLIKPEDGDPAFAVTESGRAEPVRYTFSLTTKQEDTSYNKATDTSASKYALNLTMKPDGLKGGAETSLVMEGALSSGGRTQDPTLLDLTVTFKEEGAGNPLVMTVKGASYPPWSIPEIEAEKAVRLDAMTVQQLTETLDGWKAALAKNILTLAQAFQAPAVP